MQKYAIGFKDKILKASMQDPTTNCLKFPTVTKSHKYRVQNRTEQKLSC